MEFWWTGVKPHQSVMVKKSSDDAMDILKSKKQLLTNLLKFLLPSQTSQANQARLTQ